MRPRIIIVDNITGIGGNNWEISEISRCRCSYWCTV